MKTLFLTLFITLSLTVLGHSLVIQKRDNVNIIPEAKLSEEPEWNDLKVTWGINPFDSNNFFSLPRTVADALKQGWAREKNCSEVNGNRYILNGDRAVMLIFDSRGAIAGIASGIPKGLPFNYPADKIRKIFNDEGDFFSISAYFVEPDSVCSTKSATTISTGNRLEFRSKTSRIPIANQESEISPFWTKGYCFPTMGLHYWADASGPLSKDTTLENFMPIFLLYNKGRLNGFGWAFVADLKSTRYEHPTAEVFDKFFKEPPSFLMNPQQTGVISTLHVYLDSTPQLNYC